MSKQFDGWCIFSPHERPEIETFVQGVADDSWEKFEEQSGQNRFEAMADGYEARRVRMSVLSEVES